MRRNKLFSFVSIFIVFTMLISVTACTGGKKETVNETGKNAKEEVLGYPIVKDKSITLRYWLTIPAPAQPYMQSSAENEVYIEMEKITGIKVDYMNPAGGADEQFNLMLSSGDIPDMIQGGERYKGGILKGVEDGFFLDLTSNVQKYAPDYYKLLNSNKDIWRQNTFDSKILSFNRVKPEQDYPYRRPSSRKDWLEEAGMTEPKTLEEWEKYLKFVADTKQGVTPYILERDGMEETLMGAFGSVAGFFLKDGKKVDYGQIQPEFKEYLTLMNKWFSYGYIAKDFMNITLVKALQNYGNGKVAVIVRDSGNPFTTAKANGFPHTTFPYPRLKLTDALHWYAGEWTNTGGQTIIAKDSKYPAEAMRWLNYAYTPEGTLLYNYGVKDRMWVMGEDGKPKYTDYALKNPKYPIDVIGHIGRLHFGPKLTLRDIDSNLGVIGSGQESIDNRKRWADDKNIDGIYVLPPVRLSVEETEKRSSIMEEINPYVNSMVLKFITGSEPLSKFDEYVSQVKKLGIEEAVKITQAAYERYMK